MPSIEAGIRPSGRDRGCPSDWCPGWELPIGPTGRCCPLGLGPIEGRGISVPSRVHLPPTRRFRVCAASTRASRVRLPPIYTSRVRFVSIDAARVRVLSARASRVRFLAFCASRVRLLSVDASRVRVLSICATRVRPLSIWGQKTAPDGRITNPDFTDGPNPNPVFRQRLESEPWFRGCPNPKRRQWPEPEPSSHGRPELEPCLPWKTGTRTQHAASGRDPNPNPAPRDGRNSNHVFTDRPSSISASTDGRNPNPASTVETRTQHAANGPNPTPVFRDGRKLHPVCAGRSKPEFGAYSRAGSSPGIARWMKAEPRSFEWAEPVLGARTDAASRRAHCGMRQGDGLSMRGIPYASSKREKRSGSLRSSKPKRMMCAPVMLRRDSR